MGLLKAISGAVSGTLADQWKDIITAAPFSDLMVMSPGVYQQTNAGRGTNYRGSVDVISNGSKIFVPENTAAVILSQGGIESVVTDSGGYEYEDGLDSVFHGDGLRHSLVDQARDRLGYGGQTEQQKKLAFVSLREIRGIKFGTKGPLVFHDSLYGADLEIVAFGTFSIRVSHVENFVRNFVPPGTTFYAFDTQQSRNQIISEFLQSFVDAVNTLSRELRIAELLSQADEIAKQITSASSNAGSWSERFGIEIAGVGIENIEFTAESRDLVRQYSSNRMNVKAYEGIERSASDISAQQKIAQGIEEHGLGDAGGMALGLGLVRGLDPATGASMSQTDGLTLDQQIDAVKKLKELADSGALSEEEFEAKKREVMGF